MPLPETLSHRLELIQRPVFPRLEDAMGPLPRRCERFILILETALVEELVPHHGVWPGRPLKDSASIARAFRESAGMRPAGRARAAVTERTLGSRSVHEGHDGPGPDRVIRHVSRGSAAISARETPVRKERPPKAKGKRGRPKKGEELPEMPEDLPKDCGWSCKRNSAGKTESWKGYKSHIDTCDGGVPVSFILTSAPSVTAGPRSRRRR